MTRDEAKQWIEETCGKGWLPLVDKAFDSLPSEVTIVEAFQKYGHLEFRIDPGITRPSRIWSILATKARRCARSAALRLRNRLSMVG
ncbi:hypothetical protein ACI2IY_21735 [Lysobacter enzymogenes]|uniref:hypothetical protein n=1 Tax=Lysobacter enzymogenes TaxID=69 RepID=UPI00384D9858